MRAAHLGLSGSPERHQVLVLQSSPHGFAGCGNGHCFSAFQLGERMHTNTISATALEKLKRLAKLHRDTSGLPLAAALEAVAQQAGYQS